MRVHFWVREDPGSAFAQWDPDAQPERFPSGVGHGVLELAKRVEARGHDVSVGSGTPRSDALCAHLESLWWWDGSPDRRAIAQALTAVRRSGAATVIRGDVPLSFKPWLPGVTEVMPNRSSITRSAQTWLPLLPQRGLVPRNPDRRGQVRTVAVLAYAVNEPAYFRSPTFTQGAASLGIEVVRRIYEGASGDAPAWHDLSTIDAVLCVSNDALGTGYLRKPATKLVNAWVAGAIPIVDSRQVSYAELATPDVDALFVSSPEDVLGALARLRDPSLVTTLEEHGALRAVELRTERVVDQWERLLLRDPAPHGASLLVAEGAAHVAASARRVVGTAVRAARRGVRRPR